MESELAKIVNRPLGIGGKTIENRLALAPMTILGNAAFRELVSCFGGCGLFFSEMCGARRIPNEKPNVSGYFRWREEERGRLSLQIFGPEPGIMAKAAKRIEAEALFGVDINFGCSVKPICSQKCGAETLKDPDRAVKIVKAVRRAVSVPVTVKFRTGWKDDPAIPVELAKRFEDAGADALVFHPRVSPDRRARPPKWEYIGMVKDAVSIPVFGNGNVFDEADCLKMFEQTGCDGVAIGRLAVAKPWCFAEFSGRFEPDRHIYKTAALKLADLIEKHFDPNMGLRRYKKFALYYAANFKFGNTFCNRVKNAGNLDDARDVVEDFLKSPPELFTRPNMNFLI